MFRLTMLYGTPHNAKEFDRYYAEIHVPLAHQIPGLRQFTYGRIAAEENHRYYSIAQLDWDSEAEFTEAMASTRGEAAASDVPLFATGGVTMIQAEVRDLLACKTSQIT